MQSGASATIRVAIIEDLPSMVSVINQAFVVESESTTITLKPIFETQ